jgi:hypothetical protein
MKKPDIHQGGIYLVKEDLEIAHDMHRGGDREKGLCTLRKVIIPAGELLEMRYWSPAHFRDVNNQYFPVDDSQLNKLEHIAEIHDAVFRRNIADLYDILRLCLYKEVKKGGIYHTNKAWLERSRIMQEHFKGVYTK